ncbi:unnamed protein product [Amoebophrya sp. A120]|nr:unnamed protein product [Amoebophrya sp. A120]|eukprot:GSA120T00016463001.1
MMKKVTLVAAVHPLGGGVYAAQEKQRRTTHFWQGSEYAPSGFMQHERVVAGGKKHKKEKMKYKDLDDLDKHINELQSLRKEIANGPGAKKMEKRVASDCGGISLSDHCHENERKFDVMVSCGCGSDELNINCGSYEHCAL